ncbi:MAG: hypothetical protein KDD39_14640, partial [Bdellovibrionales bacterium]|nr:hypothetical protein [Bdellovibrionales bacterium]
VEIDYGNEKKVLVHTYFMGFADKHLLSYDVQVDEGFRERGLSKLMLAHFLLTRPDVAHAEAQLLETSEVAFLVAVQEKRTGRDLIDRVKRIDPNGPEVTALRRSFIRANIRFSEVDDVAKTRENILIAALDNPLTHAQIAVGMGRLKRVIVAMPDNEERNLDIRLEFDRGVLAEGDHGKVEVILAELGSHETIRGPSVPFLRLLPSGLIQQGIEQLLR